jgi:hypothetical protein
MERDVQFNMSFTSAKWAEVLKAGLENIRKKLVPAT